jgi:hypothetical protein
MNWSTSKCSKTIVVFLLVLRCPGLHKFYSKLIDAYYWSNSMVVVCYRIQLYSPVATYGHSTSFFFKKIVCSLPSARLQALGKEFFFKKISLLFAKR